MHLRHQLSESNRFRMNQSKRLLYKNVLIRLEVSTCQVVMRFHGRREHNAARGARCFRLRMYFLAK